MSGVQLVERLRKLNPKLKVLYTSGYPPSPSPGWSLSEHSDYLRTHWPLGNWM